LNQTKSIDLKYNNTKLFLSLAFLFICCSLGIVLFLITNGWERWIGIIIALSITYILYTQVSTKSFSFYEDKIIKNMFFSSNRTLYLKDLIAQRTNGFFGGFLIFEKKGSLFQKRIILELGLFTKDDLVNLNQILNEQGMISSKCNLNDLVDTKNVIY